MRKIVISVDDAGRTEVEMTGDILSKRFFTRREFDQALRATKIKYRQAKREFQRNRILEKAGEKNVIDPKIERTETRRREEPQRIEPVDRTESPSAEPTESLARAIEAKERRRRESEDGAKS